jgi:hypothetical protein
VEWREGDGFVEVAQDCIRDAGVVIELRAGVHDAVAYSVDLGDIWLGYGCNDLSDSRDRVWSLDWGRGLILINMVESEGCVARADSGDLARVEGAWRYAISGNEDGELDGRRSAVDDEQVQRRAPVWDLSVLRFR